MATIHRGDDNPEDQFTMIPNQTADDGRLTLKALGLLVVLRAKPPGWKSSAERLALERKEGVSSLKAALKELERFGYIRRERHSNAKGQWEHELWAYARPRGIAPEAPSVDFQPMVETDAPSVAFPPTEKQPIKNQDGTNKTGGAVPAQPHQAREVERPTPENPLNYDEHGPLSARCPKHAGSTEDVPCWDCAAVKPEYQAASTRRAAAGEKFRQAQARAEREREAGNASRPADFWAARQASRDGVTR
jgi:hypothetical protein